MRRFAVIMAGGGGTRFWPLSRHNMPKQLLNLSGNDAMINETIKRFEGVISYQDSFVVTSKSQKVVLNSIMISDVPRDNILSEPIARNTAPCILYAAMHIFERYGDGIMCVFPSDHHIANTNDFRRVLENAISAAEESNNLVTIGIKPVFPATGYGYIKCDSKLNKFNAYIVNHFVEKPDLEKAKDYLKSGGYYWNSGMFIWKVSVIIDAFRRFLPRVYRSFQKMEGRFGTKDETKILDEIYLELDNISVDYGILERTDEVIVIPGYFDWNDVGSWDALGNAFPSDDNGNIIKANHIGLDTKGCIIYGNSKLIATVGLENTVIVDTEDALLICPKEKAQDVKRIVDLLKETGKTNLI